MSAQPERQRIVARMAEAIEPLLATNATVDAIANAALRALESPSNSDQEQILQCTCGHSGYVQRDGPHAPDCPLGKS